MLSQQKTQETKNRKSGYSDMTVSKRNSMLCESCLVFCMAFGIWGKIVTREKVMQLHCL